MISKKLAYQSNRATQAATYTIALAGNPNVGKSTVFNALTGLRQHTGNWPGKTVANARGHYHYQDEEYELVDLPGTYSLLANSAEEEIARDFICFGKPDATVIVVDATCLERNLNLVLQVLEVTDRVVVCVNLMDEAKKKHIQVDLTLLSQKLGVPVVGTSARSGKGLPKLMEAIASTAAGEAVHSPMRVVYSDAIEQAVQQVVPKLKSMEKAAPPARWIALRLLEGDSSLLPALEGYCSKDVLVQAGQLLQSTGDIKDQLVGHIVDACQQLDQACVTRKDQLHHLRDKRIDRLLTSKLTGIPIMIALLFLIFWITISGANVPSGMLADALFSLIQPLRNIIAQLGSPLWLNGLLVDGVYKTLAWVVSVMLPPMAIFFPLFTLLEDLGYLPRVAFNMDHMFRKACAHGKQALTMCMGFGCNACGVIGCRIIDSPRERLIAILTNNFVPCNGRFPTLITVITMFFAGMAGGLFNSLLSTLMLTGVIVLGVAATLFTSKLLSKTVLKGMPSSFQLELPPFRRPQIGRVIVRSVLDRTLFVLGRAVLVAAPAGLIIWVMANVHVGGMTLLAQSAAFLDPFARLMGLDGYILMAFILGFPANEVVVPILMMSYMATGSMLDFESLGALHALLLSNGWTWLTAVCMVLFSLLHWPCGTTCLTIKKETQSWRWTALAFALPTVMGIVLCMLVAGGARLFGLV